MGDTDRALEERRRRLGERIVHLREARGYSQTQFAARAKLGKSWLSMAERGQLNPSPKKLHQIAEALEIPLAALTVDADVGGGGPMPLAEMAYHHGRVFLAAALAQHEDDWERGRRMLAAARELAEALAAEPRFTVVAGEGTPEPRLLPEATRWLLLIELAACDPFAPFEFDLEPLRSKMFQSLADLADTLDVPADAVDEVHAAFARFPAAVAQKPQLAPGPAVAVLDKAADGLVAPSLRGRDLVGWAGWSVAGGLYLARGFDRASPMTATARVALPSWRDRALAGAVAGAVVAGKSGLLPLAPLWPLAGVAVGRLLERRIRRREESLTMPDTEADSGADVADFLLALGPDWARRELGKLAVTVDLVVRPRRRTDPQIEPCPDIETILAALRAVTLDLEERLSEEFRFNDPKMPRIVTIEETIRAVSDTALTIARGNG
ncbi:helix-turn-helix domain-containing protein [Geodermatophilus sp. URMC 61]|uniref:helix-turn-helix domain-containing protein n=1 Tax=Geodermatophilus sp. URMC 61 TaxID=3423411 RepID=UPI00406D34CE